jgi:hypothetical protein
MLSREGIEESIKKEFCSDHQFFSDHSFRIQSIFGGLSLTVGDLLSVITSIN